MLMLFYFSISVLCSGRLTQIMLILFYFSISVMSSDRLTLIMLMLFYFSISVLCSDRLTQMTKTYNDIEAVNRLLEEVRLLTRKSEVE